MNIEYLREAGCKIGNGVTFFDKNIHIDMTRPYLIEIGDNVKITRGVTILTHGYDLCVLRNIYHETIGSSGKVKIGSNVFIGMNATILKGVTIGDNVIIGAASLVNKDIPANVVAAGNPARVIMTIEEYYQKRKAAELSEAVQLARDYYDRYQKIPDEQVFHEYFFLFAKRDLAYLEQHNFNYKLHIARPDKFVEHFLQTSPTFGSFEEFIGYCRLT